MYMKCDWTDICVRLMGYIIRTAIYLPIGIPLMILTTIEYFLSGVVMRMPIGTMWREWWDYHSGNVKDDINFIRTGTR